LIKREFSVYFDPRFYGQDLSTTEEMPEQIAKDPSLSEMAEQRQKIVAHSLAASSASAWSRQEQEHDLAAALDDAWNVFHRYAYFFIIISNFSPLLN
jgi:hypothetical protein